MLHDDLILVPGLILANGPTVQLSPIVAPKTIVFGFAKTFSYFASIKETIMSNCSILTYSDIIFKNAVNIDFYVTFNFKVTTNICS